MLGRAAPCLLLQHCHKALHGPPSTSPTKILKIALNIRDEPAGEAEQSPHGGGTAWPLALLWLEDAPQFARSTFADVIEVNSGAAPTQPVDAILTQNGLHRHPTRQTMFSKDTITPVERPANLQGLLGRIPQQAIGGPKAVFAKDLKLAIEMHFKSRRSCYRHRHSSKWLPRSRVAQCQKHDSTLSAT
jgi:hypothetical protein